MQIQGRSPNSLDTWRLGINRPGEFCNFPATAIVQLIQNSFDLRRFGFIALEANLMSMRPINARQVICLDIGMVAIADLDLNLHRWPVLGPLYYFAGAQKVANGLRGSAMFAVK